MVRSTSIAVARIRSSSRASGPARNASERRDRITSSGLRVLKKSHASSAFAADSKVRSKCSCVAAGPLWRGRGCSRCVADRQMEIVGRDEDSLSQVERGVFGRRDRHRRVRAVELFVFEAVVLRTEQNRDGALLREGQELGGRRLRVKARPPRGARLADVRVHPHTIGERRIEGIEMANAGDDVARAVGHRLDPRGIVRNRVHEAQRAQPHVLHRAHDRPDVDRILRSIQRDHDAFERHTDITTQERGARSEEEQRAGRTGVGAPRTQPLRSHPGPPTSLLFLAVRS